MPGHLTYVEDVIEAIVNAVMVKFDFLGPLFSFDALLGFVSCFDDVPTSSYMDLSGF